MGQAMGIRPQEAMAAPVVESKSFFLHDVFMNVAFPDADVAARSQAEMRRQQFMRVAISGSALALATVVAIPSVLSYSNNRELLEGTQANAETAAKIDWKGPVSKNLEALKPLQERLAELDGYTENGEPLSMGWMMYQGDSVTRPLVKVYLSTLIQGFVGPVRQKLEARLKTATGEAYVKDRHVLKTYMMLSDVEHLDVEWATVELTRAWTDVLKPTSDIGEAELKKRIRPHVRYYLTLVKAGRVAAVPADAALVQKVQKTLQSIPPRKRDYDMFVNALVDETYTKEGDELTEYKEFPPLTLNDLFQDRPEVLKVLSSQTFEKEKRWKQIDGPYTDKAYLEVGKKIKLAYELLNAERWVVPLAPDETPDAVEKRLKYLRQDYETNYAIAWNDWLADMVMKPPADVGQAIDVYKLITTADYPLLRILRAVEDHTQFKKDAGDLQKQSKLSAKLDKELERQFTQRTGGLKVDVDSNKALAQAVQSTIPGTFRKLVEFGVPQDTKAGKSTGPIVETSFGKYINVLDVLRGTMLDMRAKNPNVDARVMGLQIQDAVKKTDALIAPLDEKGKTLLAPLLVAPLKVSGMRVSAGGKFY
jgi:type VI secretion system protein ImpL